MFPLWYRGGGDQQQAVRSADRQELQECKRQLAQCREEVVGCKAQLQEREGALTRSEDAREKLEAKLKRCRGVLRGLQEKDPSIPRYMPDESEYEEAYKGSKEKV